MSASNRDPAAGIDDRHPYREGLLIIAAMVLSGILTVSVSVWIVRGTDLLDSERKEFREPPRPAPVAPSVPS